MFILYALVIGLLAGLISRGRVVNLASVELRWSGAIMAGLLIQVVLFSEQVARVVGDLGPVLYVASTALVLAAVVRNRAIPGMTVVVAGAASNFVAIVANGGYMPAGRSALEALGKVAPTTYSNSSVVPDPALWPLTDIFALPRWLPAANIFSIGDVLIGTGIAVTIVLAMRLSPAPRGGDVSDDVNRAGAPAH
jgi:hypothetical protein